MHRAWNRVSAIRAFVKKKKITWKYINEGRPSENRQQPFIQGSYSPHHFLPEETKSGRGVGRLSRRAPTCALGANSLDKLVRGVVH